MNRLAGMLAAGLAATAPSLAQTCTVPRFASPVSIFGVPPHANAATPPPPVTGDFDGDGRPDIATVDPSDGGLRVLFGDGQGGFLPARSAGTTGDLLRAGDFDADGRADLLVVRNTEMQVVLADANRGFRAGPVTALPAWREVATGDVNGDGRSDVLVLQGFQAVLVHLAQPGLGFAAPISRVLPPDVVPSGMAAADFNGDGRLDVALVAAYRHSGAFLAGNGDGTFARLTAASLPMGDAPRTVVADFDDDGLPDLAVSGLLFVPVLQLLMGNQAAGLVRPGISSSLPSPAYALAAGRFTSEGHTGLLAVRDELVTFFAGDGAGHLAPEVMAARAVAPGLLSLDADGDGLSDLVTQRYDGALDLWRNACGRTSPDFVIPAVVSVDGVLQTHFETEVTLANRSAAPMTLELTYGSRARYTLPSGEKTFRSVAELIEATGLSLPAGSPGGALAIRVVEGLPSELMAGARTTSQRPGGPGRGGVSYPAVPLSHALGSGASIPWLAEDSADRTNLVLLNLGDATDGPISVALEFGPITSGSPDAVAVVTLPPGTVAQLDGVLGFFGTATRGFVRLDRVAGGAPWTAYAVVNDNATGDGSFEPAVGDDALRRRRGALLVPAVVENARYQSELVVTNFGETSRRLEATWRPRGHPAVTALLDVAAGAQLDIPAFAQWLREQGVAGVPPRGGDLAGALELRTLSGDLSGILAGARTRTPAGFGVFTPAVAESEAAVGTAWLAGLRQDAAVRYNLALVNLASFEAKFTLRVHDAGGSAPAGVAEVRVGAGESLQIDRFLSATGATSNEAFVEVAARSPGPGPLPAFLTYAVVNEGATPGTGSGDGSYVPMQTW